MLGRLVSHATRDSAARVFAQGDVERLSQGLTGAALPADRLQSLSGHYLPLDDLCVGWLIVYCFPGSDIGNEESHRDDERDHNAYARCFTLLDRRGIRLASLSSAPPELQTRAMLEHRLMHTMMLDPDLLVADALRLPTLCEDGRRGYSRITLVAMGGVIQHVFYPARAGRTADQAVTWLQLHDGPDSLSAG
jgi:peroxiredoxin